MQAPIFFSLFAHGLRLGVAGRDAWRMAGLPQELAVFEFFDKLSEARVLAFELVDFFAHLESRVVLVSGILFDFQICLF